LAGEELGERKIRKSKYSNIKFKSKKEAVQHVEIIF